MRRASLRPAIGAFLLTTLSVTDALAAELETSHFIWYAVDFVIFAAILVWAIKKPLAEFLKNRRAAVKDEMDAAAATKQDAEQRLAKYDGKLSGFADEKAKLREDFARDGERERQSIRDATKAAAEKLRAGCELDISREAAKAREELERDIALRSLALAEERIQQRLSDQLQRALIKQYIDDLESAESLGDLGAGSR